MPLVWKLHLMSVASVFHSPEPSSHSPRPPNKPVFTASTKCFSLISITHLTYLTMRRGNVLVIEYFYHRNKAEMLEKRECRCLSGSSVSSIFIPSFLFSPLTFPLLSRHVGTQRLSPPTLLIRTWSLRLNLLSGSSLPWRRVIIT